ncbi:MAG: PAN domain-containing protein [Polyangiaceae bacterium]
MRLVATVGAVLVGFGVAGCGGATQGLNQTSITCPAGRTLLDGVCVSEPVADYVACVRAQGAQLGGAKHQQLSADVGTVGVRAGAAAEVSESLEKRYATTDSAMLEIVRKCASTFGAPQAASEAQAKAAPPSAAGPKPKFEAVNYWADALEIFAGLSQEECSARCERDARCRVASLHDGTVGDPWKNKCVLRGAMGARHFDAGVVSWVKGGYAFRVVNYWTDALEVIRNQTDPQACGRACEERADCRVASFHDSSVDKQWANTCVLRGATGPEHADKGVVSWVK